jgi:MerR family transcriptional regulator, redox-sensitive transcriptional activator SoxR
LSKRADRDQLTIGELAARSHTPATTIRFYEKEGVLPGPARVNGQRRYDADAEQRLVAVNLAKRAGFSLQEIRRFIGGLSPETPLSARWRKMAAHKLAELDRREAEIERMRALLRLGLACDCLSLDECDLLEANAGASSRPPGVT